MKKNSIIVTVVGVIALIILWKLFWKTIKIVFIVGVAAFIGYFVYTSLFAPKKKD